MEKLLIFSNAKELSDIIKQVCPTSETNELWNRGERLCIYIFSVPLLKNNSQGCSVKQVLVSMSEAYKSGNECGYLDRLYTTASVNEKELRNYMRFRDLSQGFLKGLVTTSILDIKRYLA